MSRLSFRQRLTLFSAAGIALVLLVGSVAIYLVMRSQLLGQIDQSLRRQSGAVVIAKAGVGRPKVRGQTVLRTAPATARPHLRQRKSFNLSLLAPEPEFGNAPSFFQVVDSKGNAIAPVEGKAPLPVSSRSIEVAKSGRGAYYTELEVKGTPMRMYVRPLGSGRALLSARSLSEVDNALNRLAWSLAITCLAGIAFAALVGAFVARRALGPVRRLSATAERITDTRDLSARIEAEGHDDL